MAIGGELRRRLLRTCLLVRYGDSDKSPIIPEGERKAEEENSEPDVQLSGRESRGGVHDV